MLSRKLRWLVLPLMLIISHIVMAQNKTITGKVTDSKDGSAVSGASVQPKGSKGGTTTKADGTFSLSVASNVTTLVITSVGYEAQEVSIAGVNSVEVSFVPSAGPSMNEVVVTGYGTSRKRDLTGSVGSVKERDFNKGVFTSPDQLIQGKVAGLQILNNSGQPGGAATIKIRGNSTVTGGGQPLYVIDGVPLDGRSARPGLNTAAMGDAPGGNPLNFINPADIVSFDVLKDASAQAIYGSRAAYGVILITTKRGQAGAAKIEFGTSIGVASIMKRIDVLDAGQYRSALSYYGLSNANDKGSDVNAMDAILRKGMVQNYNVAMSGGTENARYRFSMGVLDQEGIVRKSGFKKYAADLSANFKFLDSKKLGLDINILPSQYAEDIAPISNNAGFRGSLIGQALQWNPTEALRKADGSLNIKAGDIINPLAMSEAFSDKSKVTTILASIAPYYKITSSLEYKFLYSINYQTGSRRSSTRQDINFSETQGKGLASIGDAELVTQQFTHTLSFNKQITTNLNLNAVAGFEYMKYKNKGSGMSGLGPTGGFGSYGLDYTNYIQFSDPGSRSIYSYVDPVTELQSYFARAVFNYKDKYIVTGTFRADGSTKFGKNNNYGYFPSFAGAWNVSKEDFFKVSFINSLKLRIGWGKTGNQEFPAGSSQARYAFGNNGSLGQTNYPNEDLKWQSDRQYNIGLDFSLLKNKITATVDYFNKKTTDLLFPSVPDPSGPPGSAVIWKNLQGFVENKGVEATVNASIVNNKDFGWDLGVNATFIKNNVDGLPAPIFTGGLHGQGVSGTLVETIRNGIPINSFWTRKYEGMDKATGLAVYTDQGSTFYYVGDPNPKTLLGISTSVRYKKFNLSVNMNGAMGQDIYNNTLNNVINVSSINGGRNIAVSVFKDPVKESFANPVTSSSRFIEKGSYVKLSNATLNYNVGAIGKVFKAANVYITGQNLFVITKFDGFDPEVNVDKNNNGVPSVGIEYTPYPSARTITFGVNFSL